MGNRTLRLPLHDYKLLDLPPIPLYGGSLALLNLIVQLEFLLGLVYFAEPLIGHAESIVCFRQLWIYLNRLCVELEGLLVIVSGSRENAELQIAVGAF